MFFNHQPFLLHAFLDLLLYTVATDDNDGYQRFLRSADFYGYNVTVKLQIWIFENVSV